jgi:hypothetical protein
VPEEHVLGTKARSSGQVSNTETDGPGADAGERTPGANGVDLTATRRRLEASLRGVEDGSEPQQDKEFAGEGGKKADSKGLLERVEGMIDPRSGPGDDLRTAVTEYTSVAEAVSDQIESINIGAIPDAVDIGALPSVIDAKAVPKAIADGRPVDAVHTRKLLSLIDFKTLLENVDLLQVQNRKSALDEAVAAVGSGEANGDGTTERGDESSGRGDRLRGLYAKVGGGSTDSSSSDRSSSSGRTRSGRNPTTHSTVPATPRPDLRAFKGPSMLPR